jgi:hypothetical protein
MQRTGQLRNVYIIFVGIPEGKRAYTRPMHRYEDIRKITEKQVGMYTSDPGQRPVMGSCKHGTNLTVP